MSARSTPQERLEQMVEPLLFWFSQSHRDLPWRREPSPYHVWVSEVMLQQTRVEAVRPYYERFLAALPTVQALAGCPQEQLLKLWEGLGYYSRARNLQRAAQEIVRCYNGQLPASCDLLKKLPGIGDYTAGAIASIAFDLPVPAVDGNVLRVLTRVLACPDDIALPATKEAFRQLLLPVEPTPGAGAFNQALMELGAVVCLPNSPPQCLVCPLQGLCLAHQQGRETDYPVKAPKKARRHRAAHPASVRLHLPRGKTHPAAPPPGEGRAARHVGISRPGGKALPGRRPAPGAADGGAVRPFRPQDCPAAGRQTHLHPHRVADVRLAAFGDGGQPPQDAGCPAGGFFSGAAPCGHHPALRLQGLPDGVRGIKYCKKRDAMQSCKAPLFFYTLRIISCGYSAWMSR